MPSPQNNENTTFLRRLFGRLWSRPDTDIRPVRGAQIHLVILDGTMSTLRPGWETNAGLAYALAQEMGSQISIYYEPGLQWRDWRSIRDVAAGRGINRQIRRAYGYLASRYREGDRIYLMGYSRGAYAVRSLAGLIDRVGLLHRDCATERNIRQAYRLYEGNPDSTVTHAFAAAHCCARVPIDMIGVWDTVKSLGINAPVLWRLSVARHAFHNHHLGRNVNRGYLRWRGTRHGSSTGRCCGKAIRSDLSRSNRCGFGVVTVMLAGNWGAVSMRGHCPTFRSSGCWSGPRLRACLCPTAGRCGLTATRARPPSGHGRAGASSSSRAAGGS